MKLAIANITQGAQHIIDANFLCLNEPDIDIVINIINILNMKFNGLVTNLINASTIDLWFNISHTNANNVANKIHLTI